MIRSSDSDDAIFDKGKENLSRKDFYIFSTLVCLIIGLNWSNEQNHYNYISTYLQRTKGASEQTGAYGQFLLSVAITLGRLLNIFLTMIVKVEHMIFVNFILMIAGNMILLITGKFFF